MSFSPSKFSSFALRSLSHLLISSYFSFTFTLKFWNLWISKGTLSQNKVQIFIFHSILSTFSWFLVNDYWISKFICFKIDILPSFTPVIYKLWYLIELYLSSYSSTCVPNQFKLCRVSCSFISQTFIHILILFFPWITASRYSISLKYLSLICSISYYI